MKIEKNKIVFATVLATLLIFLVSYTLWIMSKNEDLDENLEHTAVPALNDEKKVYDSKLDAVNDLKEVRQTNAPSIYDEKLIDSLGYYDVDLPEKEKERLVDSVYTHDEFEYAEKSYPNLEDKKKVLEYEPEVDSSELEQELKNETKAMGLEHQLFFASAPVKQDGVAFAATDSIIYAVVDGDQVVKAHSRLRMRLTKTALIGGQQILKNTPVYGFVSFQPNRVLIEIQNIQHHPSNLKAFDLQDGSEGIYVENNFQAEATNEVLDDIIGDINIPSVPQVKGITKVLKRNNRNVKVTVVNNYKLLLKPKL